MPRRKRATCKLVLHRIRQPGQAQGIRHVATAFAENLRQITLGIAILSDQCLITLGLFQSIEIGALHVLNDRKFQRLLIIRLNDDDGNIVQTRPLCASPAPLTSDNLKRIRDTGTPRTTIG